MGLINDGVEQNDLLYMTIAIHARI